MWLSGKESFCQGRDANTIPGSERSHGGGNGNPLQYSCLGNPMDRGAWWAIVHGVTKSQTWLSDSTTTNTHVIEYCYSGAQSCLTLFDSMDCSLLGFAVLYYLLEFAQTHVYWVGDAIQSSHLLSSPLSSCFKSFPASGSFPRSQLFPSGGQSIGALASFLPMNIQDWFP